MRSSWELRVVTKKPLKTAPLQPVSSASRRVTRMGRGRVSWLQEASGRLPHLDLGGFTSKIGWVCQSQRWHRPILGRKWLVAMRGTYQSGPQAPTSYPLVTFEGTGHHPSG